MVPSNHPSSPPVSVIVPSLGRASLTAVLTALRRQQDPPEFEIIVAIDGQPADDLALNPSVHPHCSRLLRIDLGASRGVSVARNEAIDRAEGRTLGFLDDDVIPQANWLATLARHFDDTARAAVTGRILEDGQRSTLSALRRVAFDHRHHTNLANGDSTTGLTVDYLNGGNCAVRTEIMRQVGCFDPSYVKSQDRELARRLLRAGHRISYAPDLVVEHGSDYCLQDLVRGRYRAGRSATRMSTGSDRTSVGPTTIRQTYGAGTFALAREHGLRLAAASALSGAAYRIGRSARPE